MQQYEHTWSPHIHTNLNLRIILPFSASGIATTASVLMHFSSTPHLFFSPPQIYISLLLFRGLPPPHMCGRLRGDWLRGIRSCHFPKRHAHTLKYGLGRTNHSFDQGRFALPLPEGK
ncbi:hypothetical protein P154DRAFT_526351 [Amniculicola lignicola CBS 123094]|uniref:Uncharacterized protein n=1 Tax=Amniculicola lignicola CBS 123094 TaxID=1392246 RepID=A0A6A5W5P5_9PLEO|nr:hypothetical protein P154DRAFT_526351 [Amniculicola lignicola CBS 123094]